MSEKFYALLLRLYPARFHRQYGEEAMRILRERLRDERGALARMRLWLDLFIDLLWSVPHEYGRTSPPAVTTTVSASGPQLFHVLEAEPPRPGTFLAAAFLALVSIAAFGFLLQYAGERGLYRSAIRSASAEFAVKEKSVPPKTAKESSGFMLDEAERSRVIAAAVRDLRQYDPDSDDAERIAGALTSDQDAGRYRSMTSGAEFANLLNEEIALENSGVPVKVFYSNLPFAMPSRESTTNRIDDHFAISIPVADR